MSDVIEKLKVGRGMAWSDLTPAFDHAIILAEEAEYAANRAANEAMTHVPVNYPPLVRKLAESIRDDEIRRAF